VLRAGDQRTIGRSRLGARRLAGGGTQGAAAADDGGDVGSRAGARAPGPAQGLRGTCLPIASIMSGADGRMATECNGIVIMLAAFVASKHSTSLDADSS